MANGLTTQAIVMRQYGPPEVLTLAEMALPALAPGELRIRMDAAAVNHTNLEIRAGRWPIAKSQPFPYLPGLRWLG